MEAEGREEHVVVYQRELTLEERSAQLLDPKKRNLRRLIVVTAIKDFFLSRAFRKFIFWLSNAALSIFVLLSKLQLNHILKYFMASAQIPIDLLMLGTQLKKMHAAHSSWLEIIGIGLLGFVPIIFYILYDVSVWGSKNPAVTFAVSIMPPVFAALAGLVAVVNAVKLVSSAINHFKHPMPITPLTAYRFTNKIIKTVGMMVIAALLVPAVLFPPLTFVFFGVIAFAFTSILVSKFIKMFYEIYQWKKAIRYLETNNIKDPYEELLGTQADAYKAALGYEAENPKLQMGFIAKIKNTFSREGTIDPPSLVTLKTALSLRKNDGKNMAHMVLLFDLLKSKRGRERYQESKLPPKQPNWAKRLASRVRLALTPSSKGYQQEAKTKEEQTLLLASTSREEEIDLTGLKHSGNVLKGVGGSESKSPRTSSGSESSSDFDVELGAAKAQNGNW